MCHCIHAFLLFDVLINCMSTYLLTLIAHIKHVPYRSMYFLLGHCRYRISDFFTPSMFFSWDWCMLNMLAHDSILMCCFVCLPTIFSLRFLHFHYALPAEIGSHSIVSHHFSFAPDGGHMQSIMHPCTSTWQLPYDARFPSCLARDRCDLCIGLQ